MNRPQTPYEAASYDLKKFRDRRMADNRFSPWTSEERRIQQNVNEPERTPDKGSADAPRKKQISLKDLLDRAVSLFK